MALIDTNIILRYLIGDDVVQSPQAREIINQNNVIVRIEEGFDKPTERVDFEAYGAEKAEFTRSK